MSGNEKDISAEKKIKNDDSSEKKKFYELSRKNSKILRSKMKMDSFAVDEISNSLLNNRISKSSISQQGNHTKNKEENLSEFKKQFNNWNLPYDISASKFATKIPLYEKMKYNTLKSIFKFESYIGRYVIIKTEKEIFEIGKIKNCNKNKIITINIINDNEENENENEFIFDISNNNPNIIIYLVEYSFFLKKNKSFVLIVSNFLTKEFLISRNEKENIIYSGFIIDNQENKLIFNSSLLSSSLTSIYDNSIEIIQKKILKLCLNINNALNDFLEKNEYIKTSDLTRYILFEIILNNELYLVLSYNPSYKVFLLKNFGKNINEWKNINQLKTEIYVNILKGPASISSMKKNHINIFNSITHKNLCNISIYDNKIYETNILFNKKDSLFSQVECAECSYHIYNCEYYLCYNCGKVYHAKCLDKEKKENIIIAEKFSCDDIECRPCCLCYSNDPLDNNNKYICINCHKAFHIKCLYKDIRNIYGSINKESFKCENCIYCVQCGVNAFTINKFSKDNKFNYLNTMCIDCERKRNKKEFCPLCDKLWIESEKINLIECNKCKYSYHKFCDRILDGGIFKKNKYYCPICRTKKKNKYLENFIKELENLDKDSLFINPIDTKLFPNYEKVITKPMCYKFINEKIMENIYLKDIKLFFDDILLIMDNAMIFNKPRDFVYEVANKMKEEIEKIFKNKSQSIYELSFDYWLFDYNDNLHKDNKTQDEIIEFISNKMKELFNDKIEKLENLKNIQTKIWEYNIKWNFLKEFNLIPYNKSITPQILNNNIDDNNQLDNDNQKIKIILDDSDISSEIKYPVNHIGRPSGHKKVKTNEIMLELDLHNSNFEEPRKNSRLANYFINSNNNTNNSLGLMLDEQNNSGNNLENSKEKDIFKEYNKMKYTDKKYCFLYPIKFKDYAKKNDSISFSDYMNSFIYKKEDNRKGNSKNRNKKDTHYDYDENEDDNYTINNNKISKNKKSKKKKLNIKQNRKLSDKYLNYDNNNNINNTIPQIKKKKLTKINKQNQLLKEKTSSDINILINPDIEENIKEKEVSIAIESFSPYQINELKPYQIYFSKFNLIFNKNCFLCGSFEDQNLIITCIKCNNNFHFYCIDSKLDLKQIIKLNNWKCSNCKYCEKCFEKENKNSLLYCMKCNNCYHSECLPSPFISQNKQFKCENCFKCQICLSDKYYNAPFPIKKEKDYSMFTRNFQYCFGCGLKLFYHSLCSKCGFSDFKNYDKNLFFIQNQENLNSIPDNDDNNILMIYCNICQSWYHSKCIGFDYINLNKYYEKFPGQNFICLDCCLSNKTNQNYNQIAFITYLEVLSTSFKLMCLSKILMLILKSYQTEKSSNIKLHTKLIKMFLKENYDKLLENRFLCMLIIFFKIDVYLLREKKNQTNKQKKTNIINNNNQNNTSNSIIKIENEKSDDSITYNINDNYLEKEIFEIDKEISMKSFQENTTNYSLFQRYLFKMLQKERYETRKYSKEKKIPIFDIKNHNAITHNIVKNKLLQELLLNNINAQTIKYIVTKMPIRQTNTLNHKENKIINNRNINYKDHYVTFTDKRRLTKTFKKFLQSDKIYHQSQNKFPNNIVDFYSFDINEYFDDNLDKETLNNNTTINEIFNTLLSLHKNKNENPKNKSEINYKKTIYHFLIKIIFSSIQFIRKTLMKWLITSLTNNPNLLTSAQEEIFNFTENESITNNSNLNYNEEEIKKHLDKIDPLIPSPNSFQICIFCHRNGGRLKSGRLLNIKNDQWAHINCLYWSKGIISNNNNILYHSTTIINRINAYKCLLCKKNGACIVCNASKCERKFHFICAYVKGWSFMNENKVCCNRCNHSQKDESDNIIELNNRQLFRVDRKKEDKFQIGLYNKFGNCTITKFIQVNPKDFTLENVDLNIIKVNNYENVEMVNINENGFFYTKNITVTNFKDLEKEYFRLNLNNCVVKSNVDEFINQLKSVNNKIQTYKITSSQINNNNSDIISLNLNSQFQQEKLDTIKKMLNSLNENFNLLNMSENKDILSSFDFPYNLTEIFSKNEHNYLKNILSQSSYYIINKSQSSFQNENTFSSILKEYRLLNALSSSSDSINFIGNHSPTSNYSGNQNFDTLTPKSSKSKGKNTSNINNINNGLIITKVEQFVPLLKQRMRNENNCFKFENYIESHQQLLTGKRKISEENMNEMESFQKRRKQRENIITNQINNNNNEMPLSMSYRLHKKHIPKVCIGPSRIHRNGLFASDNIKQGEIVIEYVGEIISNSIADYREKEYNERGFGDCYMFRVDSDKIIDATKYGNLSRFINHCCEPNCYAQANEIDGKKHILLYAKRFIKAGEEITYDYNFDSESEKIQCRCGAPNCRGRLN